MRSVIVCSLKDPAGTNIRERLLENFPFSETSEFFDSSPVYSWSDKLLVSSHKEIIDVDDLDEKFDDARYIFLSRHWAESKIPSLTSHFVGNFGPEAFGGMPGEIGKYSPALLKNYILTLNSFREAIPSSYGITLEATHHGPTSLHSTVLFVELGSSEKEWEDMTAAAIVAKALVASLEKTTKYDRCAIGIGGTHYPERLNKIMLNSDIALGPIVPKHSLEYLNKEMLEQIIMKSDQTVNMALVDYKGLGKSKQSVMNILKETDLEIVRV